jgi:hypothetical protein
MARHVEFARTSRTSEREHGMRRRGDATTGEECGGRQRIGWVRRRDELTSNGDDAAAVGLGLGSVRRSGVVLGYLHA